MDMHAAFKTNGIIKADLPNGHGIATLLQEGLRPGGQGAIGAQQRPCSTHAACGVWVVGNVVSRVGSLLSESPHDAKAM